MKNAAMLWELVKREKMANTKVVLSGAISECRTGGTLSPDAADARGICSAAAPVPLAADNPRYQTPSPQYQRPYDDQPLLPFPFFFGR